MNDDDLLCLTTLADAFLDACNRGQEGKEEAGPPLINFLADIYPRYDDKAWHDQGCLFFVQPSETDQPGGIRWRLGV